MLLVQLCVVRQAFCPNPRKLKAQIYPRSSADRGTTADVRPHMPRVGSLINVAAVQADAGHKSVKETWMAGQGLMSNAVPVPLIQPLLQTASISGFADLQVAH
jgi:hypothetical protein